jgi:hypothetical protein
MSITKLSKQMEIVQTGQCTHFILNFIVVAYSCTFSYIIQFYGGPQEICVNYCHRQSMQYNFIFLADFIREHYQGFQAWSFTGHFPTAQRGIFEKIQIIYFIILFLIF